MCVNRSAFGCSCVHEGAVGKVSAMAADLLFHDTFCGPSDEYLDADPPSLN